MTGNAGQAKCLYVLYLPLTDNQGRPQPRERLAWALTEVARFAGGYTALPPSDGAWVDGAGRLCYDRVLPVWVVAPAGPEGWAFFERLAAVLARLLEQQEIFIHATPVILAPSDEAACSLLLPLNRYSEAEGILVPVPSHPGEEAR